MKIEKLIGIIFIVFGLIFAIWGAIDYIEAFTNADDRIYTTATIVKIEEKEINKDFGNSYVAYAEFSINGEITTSRINVHKANFHIGKEIEIYYFKDSTDMVYLKDSEHLLVIYPVMGTVFVALGAGLALKKNREA